MVRYITDKNKPTQVNVRNYTGDGSTLNFNITQTQTENKIIVTLNGVDQLPGTEYSVQVVGDTTTCLFASAPTATDLIKIIELAE
jgi:hypothetical protein